MRRAEAVPAAVLNATLSAVVAATGVERSRILSATRGTADAAEARHLAVYLLVTWCGWSITAAGRAFQRDRHTIRNSLRRVEDARDDPRWDEIVTAIEQTLDRHLRSGCATGSSDPHSGLREIAQNPQQESVA